MNYHEKRISELEERVGRLEEQAQVKPWRGDIEDRLSVAEKRIEAFHLQLLDHQETPNAHILYLEPSKPVTSDQLLDDTKMVTAEKPYVDRCNCHGGEDCCPVHGCLPKADKPSEFIQIPRNVAEEWVKYNGYYMASMMEAIKQSLKG